MIHVEERGTLQEGTSDSLVRRLLRAGAQGRLTVNVADVSCAVEFAPGRVTKVSAGALSGAEALLRIAALAAGDWEFDSQGPQTEADLDDDTLHMLGDLDRQLARWMRYVRRLGGLGRMLAVDESVLSSSGLPGELKPFAQEFDGEHSVLQHILASTMNDLTTLRLTSKLVEQGVLVDAGSLTTAAPGDDAEAAAASWLEGNSGIFENPFKNQEEAVEEHFGAATELPTAMPEEIDEGDSPFEAGDDLDSASEAAAAPLVAEADEDLAAAETSVDEPLSEPVAELAEEPAAEDPVEDTASEATDAVEEPVEEPTDPFRRFDSPRDRILAEAAGQDEVEPAAVDTEDEATVADDLLDDMDDSWFNAGTDEDPHDFEIDYHKSSNTKYYVGAVVGFLALGGYLFLNSEAPEGVFKVEEQLVELDKLIDDKSCHSAREKMNFIKSKSVRTAHKLAVQQREKRLKDCEKEDKRMMQAKGLATGISVTGGDFSVETSKDLAAKAIAAAEGNAAIAYDQTVGLTTRTAKNFGRFVEFGEQVAIRLDDLRRTAPGEDGKFSVGLKLTLKARKKEVQYEMVSMKLRDNSEGGGDPRWWLSSPSDGLVPTLGAGKLAKGRMVSGWVTFHGIDDKVKWPSLDYHPMWEPKGFAAGLADDLSADLSPLGASDKAADAAKAADAKEAPKKPALKAPKAQAKKKKKRTRQRVARRERAEPEPRIVSKDPLAKARSYVKKRDSRRVLSEARRVLRKAPGNGEAHYLMGWAQVQMGTFQKARQSLSKATSLGAPADAWYNLGLAYQMLGDDGKAIQALQRFVALAPGHKNAAMARETLEALQ